MQKRIILIGAVVLLLLGTIGFLIRGRLVPAKAGLLVETEPRSSVLVDGEQVGTTPVDISRRAGEMVIKLVPIAENGPLAPYETKVTLAPGIKTVIRRNFGPTEEESAGEVISFEKLGGRLATLSVVSSPDAAQVFLDGVAQGFTPLRVEQITVGDHKISVSAPGYGQREITVQAAPGFKLTVVAKLARQGELAETKEEKEIFVEILPTPTGFLRVREEPSTVATEAARVTPGKKYLYIDENEDGTWYKIEHQQGKTGWISASYAKKLEE